MNETQFPLNDKSPRELGIEAFKAGKNFAQCPFLGLSESQIELRWQWQKGWLRAQLDAQDAYKRDSENQKAKP